MMAHTLPLLHGLDTTPREAASPVIRTTNFRGDAARLSGDARTRRYYHTRSYVLISLGPRMNGGGMAK